MENDDNDLKDYSLPLLMKQSIDDRDDNAKPDLFDGSSKANLKSLKGKLIYRNTQLDIHAPSTDEDHVMSDATSELTSQKYERQTASGEDVMPYTNLSSSSGPGWPHLPSIREMLGDTIGHYHVIVENLCPEINDDILEMAFSVFGRVSDARVMRDTISDYAFVAFVHKTDAEHAIATMNGKRLGTREIRVNWANQETQRIPCTTTASFHRPVTSSSTSASSSFEYSTLDSFLSFVEPRDSRLFIDGGFLEGVGALDYRPDLATSGSTDPSEGFPGTLPSDYEERPIKKIALAARMRSSQARRKKPESFVCVLCRQTFTSNANLKSKLSSTDVVALELINIFQTMPMFTWSSRSTVVVV